MRASALFAYALTAAALLPVPAAHSGEGASTTYLNVRSGPSAGNARVGGLAPGDVVSILRCETSGWCQVAGAGVEGWVSARFLTAGPSRPQLDPRCSWQLDVTLPDPVFNALCPPGVEPPPPPPPPGDLACFFERDNFGGTRTCREVGDYPVLPLEENDRIGSVQISGEARVRICEEPELGGACVDLLENALSLEKRFEDNVSSLKIYTGFLPPPPPPPPEVHAKGTVELTVNGRANLDSVRPGPAGADIWWRPMRGDLQLLEPVNGAQLSLGDGNDRDLQACRAESYSETPLDAASLRDGAVVCIKTNLGRTGRFQVVEADKDRLSVGFTIWVTE